MSKFLTILLGMIFCSGCLNDKPKAELDKIIFSIFNRSNTELVYGEKISPNDWTHPYVIFAKLALTSEDFNLLIKTVLPEKCNIEFPVEFEKMNPLDTFEKEIPSWYQPNKNYKTDYFGFYNHKEYKPDSCYLTCRYALQFKNDTCYLILEYFN